MDRIQCAAFIDLLLGSKRIGVDIDGDVVEVPAHPEMRAFIMARLGELTPRDAHHADQHPRRAAALAALLREVADGVSRRFEVAL